MPFPLGATTPTEVSLVLTSVAALVAAILAFIKFGLGERGALTITQAQGANTILDAALKSLNLELERKDEVIEALLRERDQHRVDLHELREAHRLEIQTLQRARIQQDRADEEGGG